MSIRTSRRAVLRSLVATVTAIAAGATVVATVTPAGADLPAPVDPTVTRVSLGGATDADQLAPDGTGRVWFALPGSTTYGHVSGSTVTSFTGADPNTGEIAVYDSSPYLWAQVPPFMFWDDPVLHLFRGGTDDTETDIGQVPFSGLDGVVTDMATSPTAGLWTTTSSPGSNYGRAIGYGSPCAVLFCSTQSDPEFSAVAFDDAGYVWGADSAQQWDGTENVRRLTPGAGDPAQLDYTISSKVGKLAWSGNSLYGSVPGQSVLRQIIPGTAPAVTEIDYSVSGVVGDVETDHHGNVWFSLAGQSKLGLLRNGTITEFAIPAPAIRLAFDATTGELWWSESGTAKVAHLDVDDALSGLFPVVTTTTAAPTTTVPTTAAPPTTAPAPADTTAPTAPLVSTRLAVDRFGVTRPAFGPASEPMAIICEIKVAGRRVGLGGMLVPSGGTRTMPIALPVKLRPRKATGAVVACATFDNAGNVGRADSAVLLTR